MRALREITRCFIHCSATFANQDIGAEEIRRWHVEDRKWADIGYHQVIRRNGDMEPGRPYETPGAHAKGHNRDSIGVCLVGGLDEDAKPVFNFTQEQMITLNALCEVLAEKFPGITFHGHNEVSGKDCPCFDVQSYLRELNHAQLFRGKSSTP